MWSYTLQVSSWWDMVFFIVALVGMGFALGLMANGLFRGGDG
jgi:hypothetical protein